MHGEVWAGTQQRQLFTLPHNAGDEPAKRLSCISIKYGKACPYKGASKLWTPQGVTLAKRD